MFVYFSFDQVRNRDYRGPDVFVVKDVDGTRARDAWIVWEENGRYPNVIIELSSPSTMDVDLEDKKRLYEKTFRTPEYFCYDPVSETLWGWRLVGDFYVPIAADEDGSLWSEQLELWMGRWQGEYLRFDVTWLRLWTPDGDLVLTLAEAEAQRADAAEAEVARLRARLASLGAANGDDFAET
jgi:Uma2 family endonuclease